MHRQTISSLGLVTLLCTASACGDTKTEGAAAPAEPTTAETAAPATPPPAPTPKMAPAPAGATVTPDDSGIVHITGNDQMQFSAARIEVKAGTVKVEMKNVGALPKEAMGHNFVVLKPGSDVAAFGSKAIAAKVTDYIPADAPEMLGHTKLLGPGESDVLTLELVAGTYPFLCAFPGHFALMRGELVVQ